MKFGVRLPQDGPFSSTRAILKVAKEAEGLGFEHVWVNDHVIWGEPEKYHLGSGTKEAVDRVGRDQRLTKFDSLTTLAYVAAACPTIRVGVACIVLPMRPPLALTKAAVALSELSEGRFILGVCAGNIPE